MTADVRSPSLRPSPSHSQLNAIQRFRPDTLSKRGHKVGHSNANTTSDNNTYTTALHCQPEKGANPSRGVKSINQGSEPHKRFRPPFCHLFVSLLFLIKSTNQESATIIPFSKGPACCEPELGMKKMYLIEYKTSHLNCMRGMPQFIHRIKTSHEWCLGCTAA